MDFHAEDVEWSAIGVEGGVYDPLVITGYPQRLPEVHAIKQIEGAFHASSYGAIPDETINASKPQVVGVRLRDPPQADPHARDVPGTQPRGAFGQHSEGG